MLKNTLLFLLVAFPIYSEMPWGKDADLVYYCPLREESECCEEESFAPFAKVGELCVRFHQVVISPIDGPRSHFIPSSSQYTIDAMRKYGFLIGVVYGCDRLMRENDEEWYYPPIKGDYGYLKFDPVR